MNLEIKPLGDRTLLVNFQQKIDPQIHLQVMSLSAKVSGASIEGVSYVSPSYCSLTIGYDPDQIRYQDLRRITGILTRQPVAVDANPGRSFTLPVCYQQPYAIDLPEVSVLSGLSPEDVIELHTSVTYRVYMIGFLPGFPYLGILPPQLRLTRMKNPRLKVPERSVGIAGLQTGIYPTESPGGWHILGSTPFPVFNSYRESPFLLQTGDQVNFKPVDRNEYQSILLEVKDLSFNWDTIHD